MPSEKPPLPAKMFDPFPRIDIDTSDGSPFRRLLQVGLPAADQWTFGPDGPYQVPRTPAEITSREVSEVLLHLLELGVLDIDTDRLDNPTGLPTHRLAQNPAAGTEPDRA